MSATPRRDAEVAADVVAPAGRRDAEVAADDVAAAGRRLMTIRQPMASAKAER